MDFINLTKKTRHSYSNRIKNILLPSLQNVTIKTLINKKIKFTFQNVACVYNKH